jgi:hypothetical protein
MHYAEGRAEARAEARAIVEPAAEADEPHPHETLQLDSRAFWTGVPA